MSDRRRWAVAPASESGPTVGDADAGPVELNLLGPLELRHGGELVAVASAPGRALLGVLAAEWSRPQARERLAALFWADHSQSAAFANLRQVLARLRRSLPEHLDLARVVVASGSTLALDPDTAVDLARFEALVTASRDHEPNHGPGAGPAGCPDCYRRLHEALALHRGELLAGVDLPGCPTFDEWLTVRREAMRRQLVTVAEALVGRDEVSGGDPAARQAHALTLVTLDPLREEAHRALMRALADAGDRTGALARFDVCHRILADELGVEPEPETLALRDQIRAGWPSPAPTEVPTPTPAPAPTPTPAEAPVPAMVVVAAAPSPTPKHNLPGDLTPFVGRSRELAELTALTAGGGTRLLTLSGVGGMGKTRLALELARSRLDRFPDGVYAVPLAQLANPADVAPAIASALGVAMNAGDPHHGGDPRWALLSELRHRRMLLVLDNFEHLLDGVDIVAEVLREAPGVEIVATSRERLNLQGEQHYRVGGLAYEVEAGGDPGTAAAVQLFVQAARRVDPGFALDPVTTPAVVRICRLVDGMPLGLELAAAWSESLSADEIAEEIRRSLDFLTVEWSNLPERQRSIRAVFDSSWRLLDEAEQRAFRALAVFRGGFTREAAQEVAGTSLAVLTRLVRKALLNRAGAGTGGSGPGSGGRYEVHELLRQFSVEQLSAAPGEAAELGTRHTAYYLGLAEAAGPRLGGADEGGALEQIDAEHDNLRAALQRADDHGHHDLGLRLGVALWPFWQRRCHLGEGRRWFARFLPDPGRAGPGGPAGAVEQLLAAGDDPEVLAEAFLGAAWLAHDQDDFDQADLLFDASLRIEASVGITRRTAAVQAHRGVMARGQGRYREAIDLVEDSLALARADGDELGVAYALFRLGLVTREHGEYERAAAAYHECLAAYERLGDRTGASFAILGLGDIARDQGDHEAVVAHCERSLAVNRELGRSWGIGFTLNNLALAAMVRGDLEEAEARAAEALGLFQAHGIRGGVLELHVSSAQIALARGDLDRAAGHVEEALATGWPAGPLWLVVSAVEERARLLEATGQAERAAALGGRRRWLAHGHGGAGLALPGGVAPGRGRTAGRRPRRRPVRLGPGRRGGLAPRNGGGHGPRRRQLALPPRERQRSSERGRITLGVARVTPASRCGHGRRTSMGDTAAGYQPHRSPGGTPMITTTHTATVLVAHRQAELRAQGRSARIARDARTARRHAGTGTAPPPPPSRWWRWPAASPPPPAVPL